MYVVVTINIINTIEYIGQFEIQIQLKKLINYIQNKVHLLFFHKIFLFVAVFIYGLNTHSFVASICSIVPRVI